MPQTTSKISVTPLSHPCFCCIYQILHRWQGGVGGVENSIFWFFEPISIKTAFFITQNSFGSHFTNNSTQTFTRVSVTKCDLVCNNAIFEVFSHILSHFVTFCHALSHIYIFLIIK